ncbi:MAG: DUF2752 domain-containing protein [Myxococcota bacterium]|nr:DUF2752 domain-containing protein [Myxococcota bacterium]
MNSELRLVAASLPLGILLLAMAYSIAGFDVFAHLPPFAFCFFKAITNIPCPGCGMGGAIVALSQFDFTRAMTSHPFAFPLVLGSSVYALKGKIPWEKYHHSAAMIALVGVILLWVDRLYQSRV